MKCKAKRSNGEKCNAWAVHGREVCRVHGGATPRGVKAGRFKHGRYSLDLPTRLAGKYEQAQRDPDLLALKEEVSLVDTRLAELVEAIDDGDESEVWRAISEAIEQRRKLVEAERRRLVDLQMYITAEQAMLLVSALVGIVRENVTDAGALAKIDAGVARLLEREET